MAENRLQSLLASASLDVNNFSNSNTASQVSNMETHFKSRPLELFQQVGSDSVLVSNPLKRNIKPSTNSSISIGTFNERIKTLYVDEIYVKNEGIKFLNPNDNSFSDNFTTHKSQLVYSNTTDEIGFSINESSSSFSSGSIDVKNNFANQEHFNFVIPSSSVGYGGASTKFQYGIDETKYNKYEFIFTTSSLTSSGGTHGFFTTPSGSEITIQSEITGSGGSVSKFVQAFNEFKTNSSSLFPLTASIQSSSTTPFSESVIQIESTISGQRIFPIQNFISTSLASDTGSLSITNSPSGFIQSFQITGSNVATTDVVVKGGNPQQSTGKVVFKSVDGNGREKSLLKVSASAEDIVQFGEENSENRFWKFKKDGRIVYSPSNSSDTFELNVSQSLEFAKRENFGKGTKTSFTKTKGDTDETKRVTDVTNIRLPYDKGITLVSKDGIDTIGGFGITTTDLSSSLGDINVENVIRFKGAGGYSFQNAIGNPSFHIDRLGNAAFGSVGITSDHWDASANFHVTGSKSANIFRVSTDTDVINIKDNKVTLSGSLEVSGSIIGNMTTMTNHAYFDNSTNERNWLPFTPFGTSETNMWTSSRDNTHRFIAPHNGQLKRVMIINNYFSASDAHMGETKIALTVFPQLTGSEEATKTVDFNTGVDFDFSASVFNKGDLLGVYVQPTGPPRYVNVTCVWEYDTRT